MTEIEVEICKPLLKWVGGKSQIIDKITKKFQSLWKTIMNCF